MLSRLLNFDVITLGSIENAIQDIDKFNTGWHAGARLSQDELRELRQLATVQSVGSSTRIEGSKLTDEEIVVLIEDLEMQQMTSRDEQEVAGYFQVLEIILEQYDDIDLTESMIKGLHNELMRHSVKDDYHKGDYKQLTNSVVATNAEGEEKLIFDTTSPMMTADAMRDAINWLDMEMERGEQHPLVVIAIFIYEFLSIHPFQDGNGRLSRLLTTQLLLTHGYEFIQYSSLERVIEDMKPKYYKALMLCQRHRGKPEEEAGRWVYFLLKSIKIAMSQLDNDISYMVSDKTVLYMNKRQRRVLEFVREEGELSVKRVNELLGEISRNTVKYDLGKLTESGYLRRVGKGRGTVYVAV